MSQAARVFWRWLISTAVATCSVAACAANAQAEARDEAVRIRYTAPESCPNAADFSAQLRQRTQRGRFAEANELARTFEINLTAEATGYSGRVEFLDESGARVNRRVHGEQCEAVVSSLALITALALDATLQAPNAEAISAPPAPTAPAPSLQVSSSLPPRTSETPSPSKRRPLRAVRAGLQAAYGSVTSAPRLGLLGEVEFRGGVSLRLTGHYAWHELEVDAGRSADLRLLGMETSVCPWRFDWGVFGMTPCAALDLGALRAAGVPSAQLTAASGETIWWASVGGQLALAWRPAAPFWFELRGAVEFPLRAGYRFTFENPAQTAYQVPYSSAWVGISAGVRFW